MAKNTESTKNHQTTGDDANRALLGVPGAVSYDLLRVWVADRYQADSFEIAHELGLEVEPTWFSNEGDVDCNAEDEREKRDKWREWKTAYNRAIQDDPARYRRVLAKICLQYADEFLSIAGITRPTPRPSDEEYEREARDFATELSHPYSKTPVASFPKAIPAGSCPCGAKLPPLAFVYRGVRYCSISCPSVPDSAGTPR